MNSLAEFRPSTPRHSVMVIWFCLESVMNSVTQDPGLARLRHAVAYRAMKPPI